MRGVDISNWQGGLSLWDIDIDFAIMKATEGNYFVDQYCDGWVQQAKEKGIKWGFYHFANNGNPYEEARFFVDNCSNYFHDGIPILDIEDSSIEDWGHYADCFCMHVHELTGVWPIVYCSASQLPRFEGHTVSSECGLWLAGYPYPATDWTNDECPYGSWPWPFMAIWQFTSSLNLPGYDGNLDGNIAYMDAAAWDSYAGVSSDSEPQSAPQPESHKTVQDVAFEVILGEWGEGDYRRESLNNAGFNYDEVQAYVNEIYDVANRVIRGDYGNGDERVQALSNEGYNPECVQYVVNALLA